MEGILPKNITNNKDKDISFLDWDYSKCLDEDWLISNNHFLENHQEIESNKAVYMEASSWAFSMRLNSQKYAE